VSAFQAGEKTKYVALLRQITGGIESVIVSSEVRDPVEGSIDAVTRRVEEQRLPGLRSGRWQPVVSEVFDLRCTFVSKDPYRVGLANPLSHQAVDWYLSPYLNEGHGLLWLGIREDVLGDSG
jgi:hypothetical protein